MNQIFLNAQLFLINQAAVLYYSQQHQLTATPAQTQTHYDNNVTKFSTPISPFIERLGVWMNWIRDIYKASLV